MIEITADGLRLPRISPSGWMPWIAHARRFDPSAGAPARLGLLMINVGLNEPAMRKAIEELPPVSAEGGFLPVRAFCRRDGIALPKVIKAFCERTLSGDVRRGQGPGLHALHIEFDAMKSERDISLSQDITLPEAATYLRINIISIRKLRDAGYLKQIQKRNPDTNHVKSYLTLESIRAFERRWITLGQMAEVEGSEPYHLARKLDRDGAVPISCFTGFVRVYEREFS